MKKTEDIQNVKRPRKVRLCKDGSHHPLSVTLDKLAWADQLDNDPDRLHRPHQERNSMPATRP